MPHGGIVIILIRPVLIRHAAHETCLSHGIADISYKPKGNAKYLSLSFYGHFYLSKLATYMVRRAKEYFVAKNTVSV